MHTHTGKQWRWSRAGAAPSGKRRRQTPVVRGNLRLQDLMDRMRMQERLMNVKIPVHVAQSVDRIANHVHALKAAVVVALLNEGLELTKRFVTPFVIVLALVMVSATPVHAFRLGVYFIHGKGAAALANKFGSGSAWEYWDNGAFMNYTTLTDSYGGCGIITDFSAVDGRWRPEIAAFGGYFWGGSAHNVVGVQQQLANFIRANGITDLFIVTHSMGGNTIRTLLSRQDYWDECDAASLGTQPWNYDPYCEDQRQSQLLISQVTKAIFQIQAPSAGSEAADLAQRLANSWPPVSWILQWLSGSDDSTNACKTTFMTEQNSKFLYGWANTRYGSAWSSDNPAHNVSWVALSAWNVIAGENNDSLHAEDGGLSLVSTLVPWTIASDGTNGLSDGFVSWFSMTRVGYTANVGADKPYNTVTRNNHFHGKYAHGLGESCWSTWTGSCYPTDSMRVGLCRPYLGTCPYLYWTPVPAGSDYSNCLLREGCVGNPYGADFAVRIQNSIWAYAGQRCGHLCEGCGILACTKCCPISGC